MSRSVSCVITLSLLVGCASGPPTHRWVNQIDAKAHYDRDDYECGKVAKEEEQLPASNLAGSIALAMNIVQHRADCMAARGWKLVPIDNSNATPDPGSDSVAVDVYSEPTGC